MSEGNPQAPRGQVEDLSTKKTCKIALTMTPLTPSTSYNSMSFPESPQTSTFFGARPSDLNFFSRYARARPLPAAWDRMSRS